MKGWDSPLSREQINTVNLILDYLICTLENRCWELQEGSFVRPHAKRCPGQARGPLTIPVKIFNPTNNLENRPAVQNISSFG